MITDAPLPPDETERLAALHSYRLVDTPPDERFDLFTRLGTWLFGVPLSAVNLVDSEFTFFKSSIGLPDYKPRRNTSFCAHAVGIGDPLMIVEDLAQDPRFGEHPLVKAGVRFYAGALLRSDTGHALGTLCIADRTPRRLGEEDRRKLAELATGVSAVMQLHRYGLLLQEAATQDSLTGLCNRRHFDTCLAGAVSRATSEKACALLCLDLDCFKAINDRFGHAGGDRLLREVGLRLTATARKEDVVARLGGDEFAVLVSDRTSLVAAEQLAQRLLAAFAVPFFLEGERVAIRSSIGVALCPDHATDGAGLVRCADLALYAAKRAGRCQYSMHNDTIATPAATFTNRASSASLNGQKVPALPRL